MIETKTCIVLSCDGCKTTYNGYEDEYTVHFDSIEEFTKANEEYRGEHNYWKTEGDKHYCRDCWCEREGHPLDPEATFTGVDGKERRYCECGRPWPFMEQVAQ